MSTEIPIFFGHRFRGTSKLSVKEQFNYLRHLKRLYDYKLGIAAQPLQFVMVGTTGMLVDLTVFAMLLNVMPQYLGRALAIWVAMTWNFWLNRRVTFAHAQDRPILRQYALFCLSCLVGALVNWSVFATLHGTLSVFAQRPLMAAALGILAGTALNFLLSKHIAFK